LLTLYWLASREVVQDLSDALDLRLSPRTEWTRVWA
jgi:hypothetical protein